MRVCVTRRLAQVDVYNGRKTVCVVLFRDKPVEDCLQTGTAAQSNRHRLQDTATYLQNSRPPTENIREPIDKISYDNAEVIRLTYGGRLKFTKQLTKYARLVFDGVVGYLEWTKCRRR